MDDKQQKAEHLKESIQRLHEGYSLLPKSSFTYTTLGINYQSQGIDELVTQAIEMLETLKNVVIFLDRCLLQGEQLKAGDPEYETSGTRVAKAIKEYIEQKGRTDVVLLKHTTDEDPAMSASCDGEVNLTRDYLDKIEEGINLAGVKFESIETSSETGSELQGELGG